MFNNISNPYYQEFKVQNNVEDKTKAGNKENNIDESSENLLKRFKEIDNKFEVKQWEDDEFWMAIDRLELEDEKFNFDLKKSKEKNEEKLNEEKLDDVVFDSKWKTEHEEGMERIKRNHKRKMAELIRKYGEKMAKDKKEGEKKLEKDLEIMERKNARKMEKLKVESLVLKLIHEKEMKKLEKVESKIKEQTYEEVKKLKKEGELAVEEQKYFGQVELEREKQRYEDKKIVSGIDVSYFDDDINFWL